MYKHTIRLFWQHMQHHPLYVLGIVVVAPLTFLFHQFLPPLIVAGILNRLTRGDFVEGDFFGSFGVTLLLFIGVFLIGNVVFWRLFNYLMWRLELLVTRELAERVFSHLLQLDIAFHSSQYSGALVSQTTKLLGAYTRMSETTILTVGGLVLSFLFTSLILGPRVPWFVLSLFVLGGIYVFIALLWSQRIRQLNIASAQTQSKQTGQLADSLGNILAIKSFAAQAYETRRFERVTGETYDAGLDLMRAITRRNGSFSMVGSAFSITAVVMAILSVMFWRADIATVYLILVYGLNVVQKLWDFNSTALREYDRAFGDAHDMVAILQRPPTVIDPSKPLATELAKGLIEFERVDFGYPQTKNKLFSDFNLTIKPSEKVGLVGHSGGGKTTLTKLLLRFMDVSAGQVLIDGQPIAQLRQVDLHAAISYVPQEPLLFHRSIRENIAYGKPDASEKDIRAAATRAHVMEFVKELPDGLDTLVGERGVKLSGGQRQRIAIARAMLKDAPILVLDEATSALDSISEKAIQSALFELMQGRTTVAIAHRLSTIQHLDRIIVLKGGKIVEQGTHQDLLTRDGLYAELWRHQSGGFIEAS